MWKWLQGPKDPMVFLNETATCHECGHIIAKWTAQVVQGNYGKLLYCREHRKPYDEVRYFDDPMFPTEFYRRMRVDGSGTPLGFVPKPKGKH